MPRHSFNLRRFWAVVVKEFIQMRRDRVTFGMMVGIPLLQLILFGYAINMNPKHLPTAVFSADNSIFSRTLIWVKLGRVQFVVHIPENFSRRLLRGEHPGLLLEADATDPAATSYALSALNTLAISAFDRDLQGPLSRLRATPGPVDLRIHRHYNPESVTQYNIVPGLMGVVLTMTMVIITALAITRERERGTMENLLSTPVRPGEVMIGKIIPYIAVGYVQVLLILLAARFLFDVPAMGSVPLLLAVMLVFIGANLAMGITFSTLASNQLQAVQMAFFYFLPNILLSGFMFPFRGMPVWAQCLGEILPLTHFLRIVRGILLKGNGLNDIMPELWPIALFMGLMLSVGIKRFRQTLD
ncbi:MAG: ABC transporter permease [Verrucomicrobia bacterium]|nr:ABC transporter permease [Verrucomicrobiota bacterium]